MEAGCEVHTYTLTHTHTHTHTYIHTYIHTNKIHTYSSIHTHTGGSGASGGESPARSGPPEAGRARPRPCSRSSLQRSSPSSPPPWPCGDGSPTGWYQALQGTS